MSSACRRARTTGWFVLTVSARRARPPRSRRPGGCCPGAKPGQLPATRRNGFGGEQGRLGLTPDLTLLGKIIGGGFPIGAVGGRADLLELTVASLTSSHVTHAGTFNGHLAAAVAGTITLRHLDAAAISRLNDAAAALADRILAGAAAAGVPAEVTRVVSIMNVHLNEPSASGQLADLHLALLLHGVYTTPRGMINLSTALSPGDLDDIAAAYETAFMQIRPA
jgi:glutamate-1-semialdehyde 2,1-aminomutase